MPLPYTPATSTSVLVSLLHPELRVFILNHKPRALKGAYNSHYHRMKSIFLSLLHRILHFLGHCICMWLIAHYFALQSSDCLHFCSFTHYLICLNDSLLAPEHPGTNSSGIPWTFPYLSTSSVMSTKCHSFLSSVTSYRTLTVGQAGTMSRAGCLKLHGAWDLLGRKGIDTCQVTGTAVPHHQSLLGSGGSIMALQFFRS